MRKYEVTLTLSKKRIPVYADSYEMAMAQVGEQLTGLMLLDCKEAVLENILMRRRGPMPASDTNRQADKPWVEERICDALNLD